MNIRKEDIVDIRRGDTTTKLYVPDRESDFISRKIFETKYFFDGAVFDSMSSFMPERPVVVDAGANIGSATMWFVDAMKASFVYSIEPDEEHFAALSANIALNRCLDRVSIYKCALGAESGFASLAYVNPTNTGMNRYVAKSDAEDGVEMRTIDSIVDRRVDIIKIDVEGYQLPVLKGATETIRRYHPAIMCEIWNIGTDPGETLSALADMGYSVAAKFNDDYMLMFGRS